MTAVRIHLVRHADAGDRHGWQDDDALRPLSRRGRLQADALGEVLGSRPITRLLSSPAVRCLETLGPLADRLGLGIDAEPALFEEQPIDGALDQIESLGGNAVEAALCSHGDLIPALLHRLRTEGLHLDGPPICQKASVWTLVEEDGRFTHASYHPPS